jgi:DNA-binding SARP family transcriptional activator/predicted ATPase
MAHLALKLFGSYRISLDGITIDSQESDKGRALLAYLAVEREAPHTREKLVGLFWPEQDEQHARGNLSQALYQLRCALGDRPVTGNSPRAEDVVSHEPFLLVTAQELQLNSKGDIETDVSQFLGSVAACKKHIHPLYSLCDDCLEHYQNAARLYTGDFLDGFFLPKNLAFEEWVTIQREQLHLEVMAALEQLVGAFVRQGDLDKALGYARRMVQLDELGEAGNQHVLRLLAMLDRREEAMAHYVSFHHTLAVQMGAEPGVDAKTLYQRIRNEQAGKESENIPASLTSFIGRSQELDDLWGLLRNPIYRLICVLGPGGSGKTRLVIQAARKQRYYFKDGVYFVPLSALGTGGSLLSAIAEGLGFTYREVGGPKRQLLDYLRHKKILLILDSFETMVEHAGLVAEILAASEGSKALVTSRQKLNLSGEYVYPLEGMRVPPSEVKGQELGYSSVALFLEAARRVRPGYMPESTEDVASLCRLVEGMPLSLLLASTWVSDFSVQEIAEQINRSLDFLTVEWADLPERQRSLRATFEYSWNLLSTTEQEVLMKLSVFRNPFNTQAAQHIAGANPQILHALMGKSLLGRPVEGYYQMHDLVRQYSGQKLAQAPNGWASSIRQQHSDYFLQQASGWSSVIKSPRQSAVLVAADKVIDDVLVAWEWAAKQAELVQLSRASEGLFLYYFLRYRFHEGEHACQVAIDGLRGAPDGGEWLNLEGCLLAWQTNFYRLLGKAELARQSADRSFEKLMLAQAAGQNSQWGLALLWREQGYLSVSLPEQLDYHQRSAALFAALGDPWWQATSLTWGGELANRLGDRDLAIAMHQQAMELGRLIGEPHLLARSLMNFAYDQLIHWNWENGARLMEESTRWYRSIGDLGSQANAELHLAISWGWIGRPIDACEGLVSALENLHQLGDRYYIAYGTGGLGVVQMHAGKYAQAEITLRKALELTRQGGFRREETFGYAMSGCLAIVMGDSANTLANLENSVAGFRQMGFAGELGMAIAGLALAQHAAEQCERAWVSLREALRLAVETRSRFTMMTLPATLVVLLADAGRWELAVEAYSAVILDPIPASSHWFADLVGSRMDLASEYLPADVRLAAEKRGREGNVFDTLGRLAKEINPFQQPVDS